MPSDHEARIAWLYVQTLDLAPIYQQIKAFEHGPGQSPIDPAILTTLWMYATLRGIGSARELDRRCDPQTGEIPFQGICGGVSVNDHTLADFRVAHPELLNDLLTKSIAVLLQEGLVTLDRVAQDGMRVRASAGAGSFRRQPTLEEHLAQAREQVEALQRELEEDAAAGRKRQQAARQRAAREREERLRRALEQHQEIAAKKTKPEEKRKARCSATDPEARTMKMADGGFRPAYHVQLATDTATQIITGVDVTNSGGDLGKLAPMVEQHQQRYGPTPGELPADGGFAQNDDITTVSEPQGRTVVSAPVKAPKKAGVDPHSKRPGDSPAVAAWRERMATEAAQAISKERAATAECVNGILRTRGGLQQFRVRGRPKVLAGVLWQVLAHNLMRMVALRPQWAGAVV